MKRLENALGVRIEERPQVLWMIAFFAIVQSSHGLAANAADALFFQRYGVDRLPTMILISGFVVTVAVLAHSAGIASHDNVRWLRLLTIVCVLWCVLEWAGAVADLAWVYPFIWVSTQAIIMLTFTTMWTAAGSSSTTRQAKRLFPIYATAGIAGGVLGNLATGVIAAVFGTSSLLLVQAGLLMAAFFILVPVGRSFLPQPASPPMSWTKHLSETTITVRSSRLLRLGAVVAAMMSCLFYLVYFPFSEQVAASFATEAGTATFLGLFASIATASTFVVSLFATNRLFARLGIAVSLLLVPIVYVGGFAVWTVTFTLSTAVIVRGMQWVTINAIGGTAFTALFNVVPGRQRPQILAFMTAVPAQIGTIVGGGLLIVTVSAPQAVLFVVGLVVGLVGLLAILAIRSAYVETLVATIRSGIPGVFDVPSQGLFTPMDAETVKILNEHLDDPRPEARALAVAWLAHLQGLQRAGDIEQMLDDANPSVRVAAFDSMCTIDPDRVSTHAAAAIRDEVPEIRLHALGSLQRNGISFDESVVREALGDTDPRVRATASVMVGGDEGQTIIESLLRSGDPVSVVAALRQTLSLDHDLSVDPTPFLGANSPSVREAALNSLAVRGGDLGPLRAALDDRSPRVRTAGAKGLKATAEGKLILMEVLISGSVVASEAALGAVTPLQEHDDALITWAAGEADRAAYLDRAARDIDIENSSEATDYLVRVLRMRSERLTNWVLRAMTTIDTQESLSIVARGIRASDAETRAQALEALDALGARSVTVVLLTLLEESSTTDRSADVTVDELQSDFDPWIRALAVRAASTSLGEDVASLSPVEASNNSMTLDPMDRLLVLQQVRMFSELDPEDLDLIAKNVVERTFEAGETIYSEGDDGHEMLLIVRGEALITTGTGNKRRIVQTYGPGEPVGELSLLSGEARSADVHAGDTGLMGLVLSPDDLLSVLEERPVVAVGMLGTLARRLIQQT